MEILGFPILVVLLILLVGFLSSVLHGATGLAGGIVMAAVFSYFLGIKAAIPIVTCALVFSHSTRLVQHFSHADWAIARRVLLCSAPTLVIGSMIFAYLPAVTVAIVMAVFLSISIPAKRYAKAKNMRTTDGVLATASAFWGLLAGNVIGPGFFLTPFILGAGLNRIAFVGTMACITLIMNIVKLTVFSLSGLIDINGLMIGVLVGLVTVPGNMLGKVILQRSSDQNHATAIDLMTIILIVNFLYLAWVNLA